MRRTIAETRSEACGESEPRRSRALRVCLTHSPAFLPPADKHFAKAWKMLVLLRNSFICKKAAMSLPHDISGEDLRGDFPGDSQNGTALSATRKGTHNPRNQSSPVYYYVHCLRALKSDGEHREHRIAPSPYSLNDPVLLGSRWNTRKVMPAAQDVLHSNLLMNVVCRAERSR